MTVSQSSSLPREAGEGQGGGAEVDRTIIRDRQIVTDDWRYVDEDPTGSNLALIFPLSRWQTERDQWWLWAGRLGVRIAPADKIETLVPDLKRLALIAIEFPNPGDGRGYTQAHLLRERYGFTGELRAVSYVKHDQLFFQSRCGINAFELSPGIDPNQALVHFSDYDTVYQPDIVPRLTFKRRA